MKKFQSIFGEMDVIENKQVEITNLCFFDFDHTLFKTPYPEEGEKILNKKINHKKWWESSISLNQKIFNITPIKKIHTILQNKNKETNTHTILLTARKSIVEKYVKNILDFHGTKLNHLTFKEDQRTKPERILEILKSYPNVNTIEIWDDRLKEIVLFEKFKNEYGNEYDITIHHVKSDINEMLKIKIKNIIKENITI